jgi:RNA polymerase sigma-70 factor (ECF subfamily)
VETDGELVRQALAGGTAAYAHLVRRHSARVLAVCHARVGRAEAADDLAQETLLRGLKALPTLQDPGRFGAWICGIATRTCLDWLKSAQRTEVSYSALGDAADVPAGMNGDDLEQREQTQRLMAEVERLPEVYREAVMMYYYDDVTYQQIAQTLGVSAATVNARLTKARAMLRERLGAERKAET